MLNEQQLSLLDDYIDGLLTNEQQNEVKAKISNDATWEKAYVEMIEIKEQLSIGLETRRFKQNLQQIAAEYAEAGNNSSSANGKVIPINFVKAASVAACLVIGLFAFNFLFNSSSPTGNELFASHYNSYAKISNVRGESMQADNLYLNAANFYNSADYENALTHFNKILDTQGFVAKYELYKGICLIETADFTGAIKSFEQIVTHGKSVFVNDAKWYLALCQLKTNKTTESQKLLEEVSNSNSVYADLAETIIKQLN